MPDKMRPLPWLRLGVITLILYIVTIAVYFMCFYKPVEYLNPIPGYEAINEINELYKSMKREEIIFVLVISLLFCFLVSMVISIIYEEIIMYTKPIITVKARLKSKEADMRIAGNYTGFSAVGFIYSLIFEMDNEEEISFAVVPKYYATIIEGNKGMLKYKQGTYNRFIGFELTEIE